jgi:hypothetical protein
MIVPDWSVLPVASGGGEAQLDAFSGCSRLEVIDISGSKVAVDVGISRSSMGLRALAAACLAGASLGAGVGAALASSPPPPPPASPPPASGPTGGGPSTATTQPTAGSTTQTPPPDTRAPGRVLGLHAITKTPGKITLRWSNPHASDLAGVMIRRGFAACPATAADGVKIGGTGVRTVQVDTGAVDDTRYCYAAFAFDWHGNYSAAAIDRGVINHGDRTPPRPVTGLAVAANARGQIVVTWHNPPHAGIRFDAVRRAVAPACPTGPADGSPVGGESLRRSQVDTSAKAGVTYCYRVFALDAAGNASAAMPVKDMMRPKPAAVHHPAPAGGSASAPSGGLTSTLMRGVAIAGFLMVLVMVVATIVTRRRTHSSAYAHAARGQLAPARQFGPMSASGPGALVIPALAVLGCCAAVALVLLNL